MLRLQGEGDWGAESQRRWGSRTEVPGAGHHTEGQFPIVAADLPPPLGGQVIYPLEASVSIDKTDAQSPSLAEG